MKWYHFTHTLILWVGLLLAMGGSFASAQVQNPLHELARQMDAQVGRAGLMGIGLETLNISFLQWAEDSTLPVTVPFAMPDAPRARSIEWERVSTLVREDLQQKWQHFQQVDANLESRYGFLASHVEQGLYANDEGIYLLGNLRQMLVMVEDLRTLQGEMYYLMRQGFRRSLPTPTDPLARSATLALDSILSLSHQMMVTMRFGPYSRVGSLADSLATFIQKARIIHPKLRDTPYLTAQGSRNAFQQYAWVIKQAMKVESAARTYRRDMSLPLPYRRFGPQYYTYNHQLNLHMSAEGEGLVAAFNLWCKMADEDFLPYVRAYPWIMPIDPPVEQAPVPTSLVGTQPQNLVFLIDISASMEKRLPRFQRAFREMSSELRGEDRIALVSFSENAQELLPPTSGNQRETLLQALQGMQSQGKTAILPGFSTAYAAARPAVSPETNSRVLLVTDGEFSITSELLQLIATSFREGVSLTILFLGEQTESMRFRMSRLAAAGGGRFHILTERTARERLVQAILTPAENP